MALDLIARKSDKKAPCSENYFPIDIKMYDALFSMANPKKDFPILYRLEDYCKDTIIYFGELNRFKKELIKLKREKNTPAIPLSELITFIEFAISEENDLYAVAD
ncbi:MAG: hypothetical protein LBP89_04935 [Helicobacteraceae bacterium]|jgi:hypothetical protein|nr:hypothetical protein [Helicobacteraceae bacterium]